MKHLPPLSALISFCIAAKHQSFTKAAQELNQTHGAISRSVKLLETHFGVALFERRNRRIYITVKGQAFAKRINSILPQIETACEELSTPENISKLAISCEPSLAMRWLMPRLEGFHRLNTNLDVHLSTAGGPVDLAKNGLSAAIRRSDFKWADDYWVTDLGKEFIGPVCSPSYLKALEGGEATRLHTRTRKQAWQDWEKSSKQPMAYQADKYFDHFYFSLQAAVAGMGMAIGPRILVADDIKSGLLVAPYDFVETPFNYVVLSLEKPESQEELNSFILWLQGLFNQI